MGIALYSVTVTVLLSLFVFFLVFLARAILRRDWLAAVVVLILVALVLPRAPDMFSRVGTFVLAAFGLWVLLRFGVLPLVAAAFVHLTLLRL